MSEPTNDKGMIPLDDPALRPGADADAQQGLGSAASAMEGLQLDVPQGRKLNVQAILVLGVLVIAGGALFAMRKVGLAPARGIVSEAAAVPQIPELPAGARGDHQQVLQDLGASRVQQQVPGEQVKKNPFRLTGTLTPGGPSAPETDPRLAAADSASRAERERLMREAQARRESISTQLKSMVINGIMQGNIPVVRLNGKLYRVGDTINKTFTLDKISDRSVMVSADGQSYELKMPDLENKSEK
jgi:hypothetical protein